MTGRIFKSLASTASFGAAVLLFACDSTTTSTDPEPSEAESVLIGSYTLSADTLILQTPKDTSWECEGAVKIMTETTLPPQPRRFALAGDQLRIFHPRPIPRTMRR